MNGKPLLGFLGVDPGASGGFGFVPKNRTEPLIWKMGATEADTFSIVEEIRSQILFACIENVHSMPGQGVASSFSFGRSVGFLRGLLIALRIPFQEVTPQRWQKELACRTGGNKNISKARAQQLFPSLKITHATADALLLAEY